MGQSIDKQEIPPQQSQTLVVQIQGALQLNFTDSHLMMMEELFHSMKQGIARQSELMDDGQKQQFERKIESQQGPNNLNSLKFKFYVFKKKKYFFFLQSTFQVEDPLCKRIVYVETIQFDSTKQVKQVSGQKKTSSLKVLQQLDLFFLDMMKDLRRQTLPTRTSPFSQLLTNEQKQIQHQQQPQPQNKNPPQQLQSQQQNQQQNIPKSEPIVLIPTQIHNQADQQLPEQQKNEQLSEQNPQPQPQ